MGFVIRKSFAPCRPREAGVAMVEFAIVLPLLVLILVGILEVATVHFNQIKLSDCTQNAARALVGTSRNAMAGSTEIIEISDAVVKDVENLCLYGTAADGEALGLEPILEGLTKTDITVRCESTATAESGNTRCNLGENVVVEAAYDHSLLIGNFLDALMKMVVDGSRGVEFSTVTIRSSVSLEPF